MTTAHGKSRLRHLQRYGLSLMFVIGALSYMDRGTLSVANPLIRRDLDLSLGEMGLLLSAFLWPYAFCLLPSGGLVDRLGARRVVGTALVIWSLAQAASGFAFGLGQFIVSRAVLGIGEAPTFPAFSSVTRVWYHPRDQAFAVGVWNSSASFGNAISLPILTGLMLAMGWRWMFVLMGAVGLVLAAVWFATFRDRAEAGLTAEETELLGSESGQESHIANWRQLFGFRATWGLALGCFGINYIGWLFNTWLPSYLELQHHVSISRTGLIGSIPYAAGFAGSILGGVLAGRLLRSGASTINSRKIPAAIGTAVMGLMTLVAAETTDSVIAMTAISIALFFGIAAMGASWSLAMACAPTAYVATLGAIMDVGGFIGGALAPTVTGFIVQFTGSFTPALLVAGMIGVASGACYLLLVPNRAITFQEPQLDLNLAT